MEAGDGAAAEAAGRGAGDARGALSAGRRETLVSNVRAGLARADPPVTPAELNTLHGVVASLEQCPPPPIAPRGRGE